MKIYFAHPAFNDEQRELKRLFVEKFYRGLEKACEVKGLPLPELVDPFMYAPDVENSQADKTALAKAIASVCCRLLDRCSLIIALVDDNDAGVAFELGFARARAIPAVLVSRGGAADQTNAMLEGTAEARISSVMDENRMTMLIDLVCSYAAAL